MINELNRYIILSQMINKAHIHKKIVIIKHKCDLN